MEEKLICCICGCEISQGDELYVGEDVICEDCAENECVTCECCGELIYQGNDLGENGLVLCESCYTNHYCRCFECNELINENDVYRIDDECYCEECYNNRVENDCINDYCYKPEPIFYGYGNRYYGIELEIDKGGKYGDYAKIILDTANIQNQHIYIKSDSSLDDGFEIVSHPMTLKYHLEEMDWESILQTAKNLGYYSHDTSTCGYHVHISRKALGSTYDEQEDVISKIMYFIELHWNEMLKFSRRSESNMNRWSARLGYEKTSKEILKKAKYGSRGRYVAVNIENYSTVEIRMFRGTLKYNTFIATLQMVNTIVDIAINLTDEEINHQSWSDFVSTIEETELIQYLKERNLYINEPVMSEEEV